MSEAFLAGIGIAVPPPVSTERFLEVDAEARLRHGQSRQVRETIRRIVENTRITKRHAANPVWHRPEGRNLEIEDIFTEHDFAPPAYKRARLWHALAPRLALRAAREAIADWGGDPAAITHVVTTSNSGWAEPGVASYVMGELGLGEDTRKIEINFNGCSAGSACLRTARDIVRGGESGAVLVVAVELASVQYDVVDTDMSTLIATALFGDGAGAVVVAPSGRWHLARAGMATVPDSTHLVGLRPDFEKEHAPYKMSLSPEVPSAVGAYFRGGRGARLLDQFAADASGPPALAVHPGGPNILDALDVVLRERGWPADTLDASFATLRLTGNLASAAILFVLHRLLAETTSEHVSSLSFGPGLTVEWSSLRRVAG